MRAAAVVALFAPLAGALQLPSAGDLGLTRRGVLARAAALIAAPAPFAALADVRGVNENMCAALLAGPCHAGAGSIATSLRPRQLT